MSNFSNRWNFEINLNLMVSWCQVVLQIPVFSKCNIMVNVNKILDFLLHSFKLLFLLGIGGPRLNRSALQPLESVNAPETKESSGLGTKRGDRLCTSFVAFRGATMGLSDVHFVLCTLKKWTVHLKYYWYFTVVTKPSCHIHHRRCANSLKIYWKFYYRFGMVIEERCSVKDLWDMDDVQCGSRDSNLQTPVLGFGFVEWNWWFDLDSNL